MDQRWRSAGRHRNNFDVFVTLQYRAIGALP